MAHIHLQDGMLPLVPVIVWWLLACGVIACMVYYLRQVRHITPRDVSVAAFCAAAAFAIFQVEIPILGGVHISLTPLVGILAGPASGTLVVLIVNILSAAIGHGGWGLIGANTLINSVEVCTAYLVFRLVRKGVVTGLFGQAWISTVLALLAGNLMMVVIIVISGIQGVNQTDAQILQGLTILAAVNMGMAVIEGGITGHIVRYLGSIRPDLLGLKGESPKKDAKPDLPARLPDRG